jgi:hypothetical protein
MGIVKLRELRERKEGRGGGGGMEARRGKQRAFKSRVEDSRKKVDNRLGRDSGLHIDILAGKSPTPRCPLAELAPIWAKHQHITSSEKRTDRCDTKTHPF